MMEYNLFEEAQRLAQLSDETDSAKWEAAKRFLYELKLPDVWAKICLIACALTDHPVKRVWLLMECVNGLRRQSGRWDTSLATGLLEEIKCRIDALPSGIDLNLRQRLTELWCYHGGWVLHPAGQFEQAAACHAAAVQLARKRGDVRAERLTWYNAGYEHLHALIVRNDPDLEKRFDEYCRVADATLEALSAGTDDDLRWRANIQCHRSFFTWVVLGSIRTTEALEAMDALDAKTKPAFSEAALVLEALQHFEINPQRAAEIAGGINPTGQIDWRSYALYIQTLALAKAGKTVEAAASFEEVRDLPNRENGGHLVAALITRGKK